jgi:hypothetical protein
MTLSISQLSGLEVGVLPFIQGGRILEESGDLYWRPYYHGSVGLYTGSRWTLVTCTGVYLSRSSTDINGSALAVNTNYDVFSKYNGSPDSFTLELAPWSSNVARRYSLTRLDGVWSFNSSNSSEKMRRYIGTVRTVVSGAGVRFIDNLNQRFVSNWDNRILTAVRATNTNPTSFNLSVTLGVSSYMDTSAYEVKGEFLCVDPTAYVEGFANIVRGREIYELAVGVSINGVDLLTWETSNPHDSNAQSGFTYFLPIYGNTLLGYNSMTFCYRSYGGTVSVTTSGGSTGGAVLMVSV